MVKAMKIYKNLWAGYETYFVLMRQDKMYAYGCEIVFIEGKWRFRPNVTYYLLDLKSDPEHFPVVGKINLTQIVRRSIMEAVGVKDGGQNENHLP